jgi:hypothetical protein
MVNKKITLIVAWLSWSSHLLGGAELSTAFTYQGRLSTDGQPTTGVYDFSLTVFDASIGGNPQGVPLNFPAIAVTNGLFTLLIDPGPGVFNGDARWLDIGVRTNGTNAYTGLTPRQPLTASPYSLYAPNAGSAATASTATNAGSATTAANAGTAGTATIALGAAANAIDHIALAPDAGSLAKVTAQLMNTNGSNVVFQGSGGPIDTNAFSGLGMQYDVASGEAAILASLNNSGVDGNGFLTFYTKNSSGPLTRRMVIDGSGKVGIGTNAPSTALEVYGTQSVSNFNDGIVNIGDSASYHVTLDGSQLHGRYGSNVSTLYINDFGGDIFVGRNGSTRVGQTFGVDNSTGPGTGNVRVDPYDYNTNGIRPGLSFGNSSGEGIASKRNSGGNQFGLDFYTGFLPRLSIDQGGSVWLYGNTAYLRSYNETNYGLGWYGTGKPFASIPVDGPVLFGLSGGALGTKQSGTEQIALGWNTNNTVRTPGLTRAGAETTSEPPNPAGMVIRRINSTNFTAGRIVARTDICTLERDGSNGGFLIRYIDNPGNLTVACLGMDSAGNPRNFYQALTNSPTGGTLQLYANSDNVVHFECTFGRTYDAGEHLTQVTLSRFADDFYWSGTVMSTYNQ